MAVLMRWLLYCCCSAFGCCWRTCVLPVQCLCACLCFLILAGSIIFVTVLYTGTPTGGFSLDLGAVLGQFCVSMLLGWLYEAIWILVTDLIIKCCKKCCCRCSCGCFRVDCYETCAGCIRLGDACSSMTLHILEVSTRRSSHGMSHEDPWGADDDGADGDDRANSGLGPVAVPPGQNQCE